MRVGKTLIGLNIIEDLYKRKGKIKVLIVAPKISIFKAWKDDMDKFGLNHLAPMITFSTYRSLNKQNLDNDLEVYDEEHSFLNSHRVHLEQHKGEILGLTGSEPKYANSEKGSIINEFCPIVYRYATNNAVDSKILNDYRIMVHLIPLGTKNDIEVKTKSMTFTTSEYKNYNYLTEKVLEANTMKAKQFASIMRMKGMQNYKSKEQYAKKLLEQLEHKCIIFANTKTQAERLCENVYHSGNEYKVNEEVFERFDKGEIDKLACVLQLSEGRTIKDLKASIILHGYGNEVKFSQRFARCLSLSTEEMAIIHLLAYENTVDAEKWIPQALEHLDQSKIKYVRFGDLENEY